jgi:hypothetical protein
MRFIKETQQSSRDSSWYQQSHYKAFTADCQKTAEIARDLEGLRNLTKGRKDISMRGLEHYVDEERASLRRERRLAAWDLVFDEQENQYESGEFEPEHIAEAYQEVSVRSQFEAHVKALQYVKESEVEHRRESRLSEAQKSCKECSTNLRAMLTRRPGMKNLYKYKPNLRQMLTRGSGIKNFAQ